MTLLDLNHKGLANPESEVEPAVPEAYPDEVLESEWNPVVKEMHTLLSSRPEPSTPLSSIDAAILVQPD